MFNLDQMLNPGNYFFLANEAQGFANPENCTVVISTAILVAVLIVLAFIGRAGTGLVPTGLGAAFEHVYDFVDGMSHSMIGEQGRRYTPFAMSIFLFVLICNWSSLIPIPKFGGHAPFEAPSVSFNTTFALAVVSFLSFNFYGLRKRICGDPVKNTTEMIEENVDTTDPLAENYHHHEGQSHGLVGGFLAWLGHFLSPTQMLWNQLQGALRYLLVPLLGCLFLVLNVVEELARLISLSIRLYGNLFGEHQVKGELVKSCQNFLGQAQGANLDGSQGAAVGYVFMAGLLWASSLFVTCIGALAGFIQAFIFFVLTLSYISHVVSDEH